VTDVFNIFASLYIEIIVWFLKVHDLDNKYGGQWLEQQMDKMIAGTIEIVDLRQVCKFLGMVTVLMNGLSSHGLVFRIPLNGLTLPHFSIFIIKIMNFYSS
jgi:hypothetical protein